MSWTDERVETLKRMWAEGQSASQIAKELGGVTRNAVIGKVHRLGLSNRAGEGASMADEVEAAPPAAPAKPEVAARPAEPIDASVQLPAAPFSKEIDTSGGAAGSWRWLHRHTAREPRRCHGRERWPRSPRRSQA